MNEETPTAPNKGGRPRGVWKFTTPEALLRWRTDEGVSRAEVARQLGVAFSAVERWESGEAVAIPELQKRIAKLIGVSSLEDREFKPAAPVVASPAGAHSDVLGAIVTEYIRHSKLSPEALVKLTRELRDVIR